MEFTQGRLNWEEVVRAFKRDHRRFVKRQFIWFNAVTGIHWLRPHQEDEAALRVARYFAL